jgi:uncharacterized protein
VALGHLWQACKETYPARPPAVPTSPESPVSPLASLLAEVEHGLTLRGLLQRLTGRDLLDEVRPYLIRHLAAHLDQGLAAWHSPSRQQGLYAAWLASARTDPHFDLHGVISWSQTLERLPEDPVEAILHALLALGLDPAHWAGYLESLAQELPGWSGMVLWRDLHPDPAGVPTRLNDYLAIRLVLEQVYGQRLCGLHFKTEASLPGLRGYLRHHPAELRVRLALYGEELPEWLADQGHRLVRAATVRNGEETEADWLPVAHLLEAWRQGEQRDPESADRQAWPLFLLCQHLGLSAAALRGLGAAGARALLDGLAELTPERAAWVWLQAYERHYREQVFAALTANHGRGAWRDRRDGARSPRAQLVFCMDDREEGLRRHLEELDPDVETLGAAAHLGLFIRYDALGEAAPSTSARSGRGPRMSSARPPPTGPMPRAAPGSHARTGD